MPRTTGEIKAHADELAKRFEDFEPDEDGGKDATALRGVRAAVIALADVDSALGAAVATARADGHSWAAIAVMLGTSGEAARQKYGDAGQARVKVSVRAGRKPTNAGEEKPVHVRVGKGGSVRLTRKPRDSS